MTEMTCRRPVRPRASLLALLIAAPLGAQDASPPPGDYEPGSGFIVARGDRGELGITMWTYVRYLNQQALDETYTDAFARTATLDLRHDVLHNKVNMWFRGWIYDPRFRYRIFVWTSNPNMGQGAQVVVSGWLAWTFGRAFSLYGGTWPVPSTRTTQGTFPNWLKVDHRTIADEFFRGSYTMGFWATGQPVEGLEYLVMLANNLSELGVDAKQLDDGLNTASAGVWWMPTTREYGPLEGYGDYEDHQEVATLLGLHFTRSREDSQSQPDPEDIENSQLRLSDGTNLFAPDAFAPGGQVTRATYRMLAADAGVKYQGFSLDAEYYARWLDDFATRGVVPVTSLFDQGFQVYASAMVIPRRLQLYLAGSRIFGDYGDPWDLSPGLNFFPASTKYLRVNTQALYLADSPVGYLAVPFPLGGNGWVFTLDVEVFF